MPLLIAELVAYMNKKKTPRTEKEYGINESIPLETDMLHVMKETD